MNSATHWLSTAFDGVVGFLPRLVAGASVLVVGYLIAVVMSRITREVLGRTGYDRLLAKMGVIDPQKADTHEASRWTGRAVYFLAIMAAVMQAARAWNLELLANGLARVIAYVPHLIGATLIVGASLYFSNWVRDRIIRSELARSPVENVGVENVGAGQRPLVGSAVRAGILAMGAFMALRELQIAPEIVTIAFTLTLAAIALAAALAFGLGSRGVAAQVTQQWYGRRSVWDGAKAEVITPPSPDERSRHAP